MFGATSIVIAARRQDIGPLPRPIGASPKAIGISPKSIAGRLIVLASRLKLSAARHNVSDTRRSSSAARHSVLAAANTYRRLGSTYRRLPLTYTARKVGRLRKWREKIWSRRYEAIVVSDEPAAQVDRLRYVLANGVKEGLVARVNDWPGIHMLNAVLDGEPIRGTWFNRTKQYRAKLQAKESDPRLL